MRRGRNDGQEKLPLQRQVGKALNDEEITAKSRELCGVFTAIEGLQDKIRNDTKVTKDEIKVLQVRAKNLRQAILDGIEMRKQGDLFVEEAQHGLHDIAKKVDPALGTPELAKPSEPHAFAKSKGKPFECSLCGSSPTDPVHDMTAAAAAPPAASAVADGNGQADEPHPVEEKAAKPAGATKARTVKKGKGPLARAGKRGRGKEARA